MKRFGISYYLPELYHLKGVKDAKDALARVIKNNRWADLMYLKLEFDMREFERTEMPMMKEAFELLPMFGLSFLMGGPLGSYLGCLEEKSEEDQKIDNAFYDMWDELDLITIFIDGGNPAKEV